ncbi:MAG: complex I subunit 1 family protein [bacterium]
MDIVISMILGIGTLVGAPIVAGFANGVDRRLTARLQGRVGPPLIQPFYDIFKLLGKELIVVNRLQLIWAWGFVGFSAASVVLLMVRQDLLLTVFTMGFAGICLALGALSVRSPYSYIGGIRELFQMLSYEPILLASVVAIYIVNRSYMVGDILNSPPLLKPLPLVFLALLLVLTIKMRKSPFDISSSHHAHQEIVKGVTTEYSGPYLALIELGHWYELIFVLALISLFWANPLWIGILIAIVAFLSEMFVDNSWSRMTWRWMLRVSWLIGLGLVAINMAALKFFPLVR